MKNEDKIEIIEPKKQINLYGYDYYFNFLLNLYRKDKLPNAILLNGQKGIGKATLSYHFINYLLSEGEENAYSLKNFSINANNKTFNLINNNIHPNFFLMDSLIDGDQIKIDQSRNLIKFLSKTTYSKNIKFILIDNVESLNSNSSNAILKVLEEPPKNTHFLIIQNNFHKVLDTIKSRCLTFNVNFSLDKKKKIFNEVSKNYKLNIKNSIYDKFLYFDTCGNFLRYIISLNDTNYDITKDHIDCISFFIDKYKKNNDKNLLNFITLFVEIFYHELLLNSDTLKNDHFNNKQKLLHLIRDTKEFNLDTKNMFFTIDKVIRNEKR